MQRNFKLSLIFDKFPSPKFQRTQLLKMHHQTNFNLDFLTEKIMSETFHQAIPRRWLMDKIKHNYGLNFSVDSHGLVNYLLFSAALIVIESPHYHLFSVAIVQITLFSRNVKVVKWTAWLQLSLFIVWLVSLKCRGAGVERAGFVQNGHKGENCDVSSH